MMNKICNCHTCEQSHRIKDFIEKLPTEFRKEAIDLFNELRSELEAVDTDLEVLRSKIVGVWPREDGEKYYERIDGELFEINVTKVEENAKEKEN